MRTVGHDGTMTDIAMTRTTSLPFDVAVEACRAALAAEGFGILTEIDIQATLKKKIDVDRTPYTILGACHPESANRVLEAVPEVGVLLPCNVTVSVEDGTTVVRAMDPAAAMTVVDDPTVAEVAGDIRARLERAVSSLD
jgi:uncharacterized protein (DUF302 family)